MNTVLDLLISRQNSDGGWPYVRGSSWTEPTVYAALALIASKEQSSASYVRAMTWLAKMRRPDGGWPPNAAVAQSTWVTALPLLFPERERTRVDTQPAVEWLAKQTGQEASLVNRIRLALMGVRLDLDYSQQGWPWFPGTAAWVTPTSVGILAFDKQQDNAIARQRSAAGRAYLLSRVCGDGGWNHGSSKALGYDSGSYPETTGIALLALHGDTSPTVKRALDLAGNMLGTVKSVEAVNWLELALLSHGRTVPLRRPDLEPPRTCSDMALSIIASTARTSPNIFLEP